MGPAKTLGLLLFLADQILPTLVVCTNQEDDLAGKVCLSHRYPGSFNDWALITFVTVAWE